MTTPGFAFSRRKNPEAGPKGMVAFQEGKQGETHPSIALCVAWRADSTDDETEAWEMDGFGRNHTERLVWTGSAS